MERGEGSTMVREHEDEPEALPLSASTLVDTPRHLGSSSSYTFTVAPSGMLMGIVSLLASTIYQAILSPPSGIWLNEQSHANPPQVAGKAVLATLHPVICFFFVLGNAAGFFTSMWTFEILGKSHWIAYLCIVVLGPTFAASAIGVTPSGALQLVVIGLFIIFIGISITILIMKRRYGEDPTSLFQRLETEASI